MVSYLPAAVYLSTFLREVLCTCLSQGFFAACTQMIFRTSYMQSQQAQIQPLMLWPAYSHPGNPGLCTLSLLAAGLDLGVQVLGQGGSEQVFLAASSLSRRGSIPKQNQTPLGLSPCLRLNLRLRTGLSGILFITGIVIPSA